MREKSIFFFLSLLLPRLELFDLPDLVVDTVSVSHRLWSSAELIARPLSPPPIAACDACNVYLSPEIEASSLPSCRPKTKNHISIIDANTLVNGREIRYSL